MQASPAVTDSSKLPDIGPVLPRIDEGIHTTGYKWAPPKGHPNGATCVLWAARQVTISAEAPDYQNSSESIHGLANHFQTTAN
jgi:hypothetical protein